MRREPKIDLNISDYNRLLNQRTGTSTETLSEVNWFMRDCIVYSKKM